MDLVAQKQAADDAMREEILAMRKLAKKPRPYKIITGKVIVRPDCFEPQLTKRTDQKNTN